MFHVTQKSSHWLDVATLRFIHNKTRDTHKKTEKQHQTTDNLFSKGNGRPTAKSLKDLEKTFCSYLLRYQSFKIHLK